MHLEPGGRNCANRCNFRPARYAVSALEPAGMTKRSQGRQIC